MNDRWFERVFRGFYRHPFWVAVGLIGVALAAMLGLFKIPYEGGLTAMLPEGSNSRKSIEFLRDANFADKIAISLAAEEPDHGVDELILLMDRLKEEFEASPLVSRVQSFPGGKDMMQELVFFLDRAPELLSEEDLEKVEGLLDSGNIRKRIRRCYVQLVRPEGSFIQEIIRRDPLGMSTVILERLREIPRASGYEVTIQNGHLIHPDGRHGLLLMDAAVPLTDGLGSLRLVDMLLEVTSKLPDGYAADVICGHLHTVSNESRLRSDIRLTALIAAIGFFVLFLLIFRDIRAGLIFLIPGISILVAINLAGFFVGKLSYMILGFAPVMAGIAVDYGIHTYIAVRHGRDACAAVRRILRPLIMGALTTQCVFFAFAISAIPGYRQLGGMALFSIALSMIGAVFLLPPLVKHPGHYLEVDSDSGNVGRSGWAVFFLASLVVTGFFARNLDVEPGIDELDGVSDEILETEQEFRRIWGGGRQAQAIAVIGGDTYEQAARRCDRFQRRMTTSYPEISVVSRSSVWPSRATRIRNVERWREFWTPERVGMVRENVFDAAAEYGFARDAFQPFLGLLTGGEYKVESRPEDSEILEQMESRFVRQHEDGYWFLAYFRDTGEAVEAVAYGMEKIPGSFVVSRKSLADTLAESIGSEAVRISIIAGVLILFITFFLMRDVVMALTAILPAATGLLWLLAVMSLSGQAVNVANLIAGIVVVGLCIDYGIFMVYGYVRGQKVLVPTRRAITLSAVTTLIGAGVLLFATHPALFSIGITLVIGIFTGYLTAVLGVPGMCRLCGISSAEGKIE